MSKEKLEELNRIFESLSEARKLNLADFPYSETNDKFRNKLK